MSKIDITEAGWLKVEQGRIVVIRAGTHQSKWASIVEIIDQHRVLVDGPSANEEYAATRHVEPLSALTLTPIYIEKQPPKIRSGALKTLWEKQEIDDKISKSTLAKKRVQQQRRAGLNDFERFKVMRLKKQTRFEVKKASAKIRAAA